MFFKSKDVDVSGYVDLMRQIYELKCEHDRELKSLHKKIETLESMLLTTEARQRLDNKRNKFDGARYGRVLAQDIEEATSIFAARGEIGCTN